jgi:DNA-binding XRE family transcriptional regulator
MKLSNPVNEALVDSFKSQIWLAKKINVSRQYLNSVIHGHYDSPATRRKVSKVLGRPISKLWPDKKQKP